MDDPTTVQSDGQRAVVVWHMLRIGMTVQPPNSFPATSLSRINWHTLHLQSRHGSPSGAGGQCPPCDQFYLEFIIVESVGLQIERAFKSSSSQTATRVATKGHRIQDREV